MLIWTGYSRDVFQNGGYYEGRNQGERLGSLSSTGETCLSTTTSLFLSKLERRCLFVICPAQSASRLYAWLPYMSSIQKQIIQR